MLIISMVILFMLILWSFYVHVKVYGDQCLVCTDFIVYIYIVIIDTTFNSTIYRGRPMENST